MKKVIITKDSNILTEGTKDFQKLKEELFIKDFQNELQKRFPNYEIEFRLVNVENWSLSLDFSDVNSDDEMKEKINDYIKYPLVEGDLSEEEKQEIIDEMWEDPFLTFHADGDYFEDL